MTTFFHNQSTPEAAAEVARNLNRLAADGHPSCSPFLYSSGPAFQTPAMTTVEAAAMGGVYRQRRDGAPVVNSDCYIAAR